MADDQSSEDVERDEPTTGGGGAAVVSARADRGTGFFTIYKRGQGYWTRMGTALAATLIAVLFAQFVYTQMKINPIGQTENKVPIYIDTKICLAVAAAVLIVLMTLAWRLMNKPGNVDFLIATDSEMKKVNWTTRKELIGSTKVVIFFVILISSVLFLLDIFFGYLFYAIKVLEVPPF